MDKLPTEILGVILYWTTKLCKCEKNTLIPLRLVCKAFDAGLRPYIFKCIQLEFSRFRRNLKPLDEGALQRVGGLADALYVDVMVVRDEEEIDRLTQVFRGLIPKLPEMAPLLESLRKHCMNETTFDEIDFRRVVETALANTPNMTKLKVNLPFQVVGQHSRTATLLLGNTMASLKNRPEEFKCVQHLVLDHVSDTTLIDICNNHIDLGNAIHVFKGLKHLVMSIKRHEAQYNRQSTFAQNLWILIEKATGLRSLCLVGWNARRNINGRVHVHRAQHQIWTMRSMPFTRDISEKLVALQALELKRVDMDPHALFSLLKQLSKTLLEVYLNEVYLKVRSTQALGNTSLWIGYSGLPKPENCRWLAEDLYNLESLNLTVLRVTSIGYDEFETEIPGSPFEYDLRDPSGQNRSFDERFVKAVMEGPDPIIMETINNLVDDPPIWPPIASFPVPSPSDFRPLSSDSSDTLSSEAKEARKKEKAALHRKMLQYDCDTTQR
ncbi:hypothetical protein BDZ45DRAFT_351750 [Acephala macrosclerotiorum]|nr:hypothetical protein BDZ45DRAFT_351750 [Acephala macrosclerotiorum]